MHTYTDKNTKGEGGKAMIIVSLGGGLGNQMFMYAFGRAQARKYKDSLYFSTYAFSKDRSGRTYRLDRLNIQPDIRFIHKYALKYFFFVIKRFWFEFWIRIRKTDRFDNTKALRYAEQGYFFTCSSEYTEPVYAFKKINYYNGLFQSERYFESVKEEIKKEFRAVDVPDICKEYAGNLLKINSVCVHVRRSDYCVNPALNVCGKIYYTDAIERMNSLLDHPEYYFFSEDISWVKKNFTGNHYHFVDIAKNETEDLFMMYHCAHFIIPNSTFSWWAQYLCIHEGKKTVIAPSRWYSQEKEMVRSDGCNTEASLYMDDWILVEPTPWRQDEI